MNSPVLKNKTTSNAQEGTLDSSLQELVEEARDLFKVLDEASAKIRELEKSLSDLKANFPFRYKIGEEKGSVSIPIEMSHREAYSCVVGVFRKVWYYLGWEPDESSQKYRLCLIFEENETVQAHYEDTYNEIVHSSRILSKKPLIETDLSTRLLYSEHLHLFIHYFKEYLKTCRISIEARSILF